MTSTPVRSGELQLPSGITLCYDDRGPEQGTPLLFIMGLSCQMVFWPESLLDDLAARGYRVIRFDNRDVGLSSRLRFPQQHSPLAAVARATLGLRLKVGYTLHDMVDDTIGLLDGLGIERAHLIGVSMGGMIAQLTAGKFPQRVLSLTSIMSSNNSRWLPLPSLGALKLLLAPKGNIRTREDYIAYGFEFIGTIGGTLPWSRALLEQTFGQSWDRGLYPRGIQQQLFAIFATGDLTPWLKRVQCPATVIHGSVDPLIRPAGGRASARHIRGAKLVIIPNMGHDLPDSVLPQIADLIDETARRAG